MTKDELRFIRSERPPDVAGNSAWLRVLRNRNVLLIALSYFCMNYVFYLFFNWFFFYLVDVRGFSAADAGVFSAAQWVLGAVGATAGGFGCDMLMRRLGIRRATRYQSSLALIAAGVMLIIGATSGNVLANLFGWPAAIASGSLFAFVGAALWLFVRADEPMGGGSG